MLPPSDDYNLIIRQGPERAKVAGPKEKDRKPIDPPPIIQLQIRDLTDPAQLKDVDNTDGGFFVFGDVSVKIEGEYRLRFSLFEMLKSEVVYIKSIISDPFNVYTQKNFPGMSESTFLSRSFGDQGVRLRIRKEPRTLLKRPNPASLRAEDFPRPYPQQQPLENRAVPPHKQGGDFSSPSSRGYFPTHTEQISKRQRTSVDLTNRGVFDQDQRYSERTYEDQRGNYGTYTTRNQPSQSYSLSYPSAPQPTSGTLQDYSFRHQRTDSSSTTSPYVSPRTELPGYMPAASNSSYSTQPRESVYSYPNPYSAAPPSRQATQLTQQIPSYRHHAGADQTQANTYSSYPRTPVTEEHSILNPRQTPRPFPTFPSNPQTDNRSYLSDQTVTPMVSGRQAQLRTNLPNLLPPLESTVTSSQLRGSAFAGMQ
ncbi:hypothetical protein MMC07_001820 [Pseudocyphellaria aurata]|nr:hypothetical protein [Pseudocyphellaria aurata]